MAKLYGKQLAKSHGINVVQALYRKSGDWYHVLKEFPGALLDESGHILFGSLVEYDAFIENGQNDGVRQNRDTNTLTIKEGISACDGYVPFASLTPTATLASDLSGEELAGTLAGIAELERRQGGGDPKRKHRVSVWIERGSIGNAVKKLRHARCQVCEALGRPPVAFVDRRGRGFAEAHHVIPVAALMPGSLGHLNIMVLCPNHHRQAHYGAFDILEHRYGGWVVVVDGVQLELSKPTRMQIQP